MSLSCQSTHCGSLTTHWLASPCASKCSIRCHSAYKRHEIARLIVDKVLYSCDCCNAIRIPKMSKHKHSVLIFSYHSMVPLLIKPMVPMATAETVVLHLALCELSLYGIYKDTVTVVIATIFKTIFYLLKIFKTSESLGYAS